MIALTATQQMYLEAARNGNAEAACALLPWLAKTIKNEVVLDLLTVELTEELTTDADPACICNIILGVVEAAMKEAGDGK